MYIRNLVITIFIGLFCFIVGYVFLFRPRIVQEWQIRGWETREPWKSMNPRRIFGGSGYLWQIRFFGIILLALGVLSILAIVFGWVVH